MSFKGYLEQRIQVDKDLENVEIKEKDQLDEVYAGLPEHEIVRAFVIWLKDRGISEINNSNINDIFYEFGMLEPVFIKDYWDQIVQVLRMNGIETNLVYKESEEINLLDLQKIKYSAKLLKTEEFEKAFVELSESKKLKTGMLKDLNISYESFLDLQKLDEEKKNKVIEDFIFIAK